MAEPTIFQEGTLQVTRRRVMAQGEQYALENIKSVHIATARLPRGLVVPAVLVATGALLVAPGNLIWMGVGLSLLAIVGFLWWRANRTYILILGTAEGDTPILTTTDRQLIERAAQTIDMLLLERSRR